ncbi:FtsQ-type POTRA domain-containing protein [Microbacterium cremeum]|uniref:FtsQ-type POTRA domain-containing protein n=1 Tax=Microbacterium cremeum TaxID=2782169 RepID=UPI001887352F|nr:FtsQ-type POTRA domain-containing protein [Microbacterium cremeum]
MRRPSPLPQPPAPSAPSAQRERERRDAPGGADAATGPDDEATLLTAAAVASSVSSGAAGPASPDSAPDVDAAPELTAPVIPLGDKASRPRLDGLEAATADDPADDPVAANVGLRDVWRASRARRKALRAEIRRFTVRQRRRRALWLGVAASVVVLALGTIGAAYSPLFAVERIVVTGAQQLNPDDIVGALEGQVGTPMALIDESAVKAELVGFPLIETYALEARPPHELVIRIVERTPIGLIETRAGYTLVDAAGVALSTTAAPSPGTPILEITGGVDSDAFAAAGQVMRSLPADIRAQVTAVSASTPDDVTLTLGGANSQVVWGSAERSAEKALALQRMMLSHPPADVTAYDVSSPDAVVIR